MKEYINTYIKKVEYLMTKDSTCEELKSVLAEFEQKILYFQHERLIHLIVTVLFALLEMSAIYVTMVSPSISSIVLCVMFLVLLVPYVMHYYFLENSVQKMYRMRDSLIGMLEQKSDKA